MKCSLVRKNANLMIQIGDRVFPPLCFKSFRPGPKNISDFYRAGLRLFNILTSGVTSAVGVPYSLFGESWIGPETYDFAPIDRQIDLFIENAPDAYFSLMIQLDTRDWWLASHPGYPHSFHRLSQMETDPAWREAAAKYMQCVIRHVEEAYPDRFFAYVMLCGTTTEWFSDYSHEEPSIRNEYDFMSYCGRHVPDAFRREASPDEVFLSSPGDDVLARYREFESRQRSDTVLYFAQKAQEVLKHEKLLGVYYGYLLELKGPRLWETGCLDYERVFTSPDIDMFSSPLSYEYRHLDEGAQQMLMNNTLDRHDKLYFLEHDHTTSLVPDIIEGHRFVHPGKVHALRDDIDLMRRSFLLALSNRTAMWWFDMFGGWFDHDDFRSEIARMISLTNEFYAHRRTNIAQIAIIGDPEALYRVHKNSGLNDMLFDRQRGEWSLIGAPYDLYSACDEEELFCLTVKYRLIIFLDPFRPDAARDSLIARLRTENCPTCLLFTYAAPEGLPLSLVKAGKADRVYLPDGTEMPLLRPISCYTVCDAEDVLARYADGTPAVSCVTQGQVTFAVSGAPTVSHKVLQCLADRVGIHRFVRDGSAVVYAASDMLGLYHVSDRDAEVQLPSDQRYTDAFTGEVFTPCDHVLRVPRGESRARLLLPEYGRVDF